MLRLPICLLFAGLAQAVNVYLYPPPPTDLPSHLSPNRAAFELSRHLGLESFESAGSARNYGYDVHDEQLFVGQGEKNGLLLTLNLNGVAVEDVLPDFSGPSFSLEAPSMPTLSSLISTYLHRAAHTYSFLYSALSSPPSVTPRLLDIFSSSSPSTQTFLSELSTLSTFLDDPSSSKFAALEINGLSKISVAKGRTSEEYQTAAAALQAFFSAATSQWSNINLAVVTYIPSSSDNKSKKRQPPQSPFPPSLPPQEPIGSVSTCHLTSDSCVNATNSCTGRGECVQGTKAGRTCWVCACGQTVTDQGKKETWVGEMCERKDISGPFVLITGTVIGLILLMGSSVALLYGIGEHELPSTLLAGAAPGARKD